MNLSMNAICAMAEDTTLKAGHVRIARVLAVAIFSFSRFIKISEIIL